MGAVFEHLSGVRDGFMDELQNSCKKECSLCCEHNEHEDGPQEIEARSEAALRNGALLLSSAVVCILLIAHIWFTYIGKTLPVPDIVWAIILAPWFGAGSSKLAEIVSKQGLKR